METLNDIGMLVPMINNETKTENNKNSIFQLKIETTIS